MAVSEQTPYKEYTANGSTNSFALEFDCENQDHLIVLVDDIEPVVGTWSLIGGAVVFGTAPGNGKKIIIQRNTPVSRSTNYKSSDNSFRPDTINKDFDRIWLKLQELGVADHLLKVYVETLHNQQQQYIEQKDNQLQSNITSLDTYVKNEDSKLQTNIDNVKSYSDNQNVALKNELLNIFAEHDVQFNNLDSLTSYILNRLSLLEASSIVGAKLFGSVAEGLANTKNGEYFNVITSDSETYAELYKNENGTAVSQSKSLQSYNASRLEFTSIASLRSFNPRRNGDTVYLVGLTTGSTAGGGKWYYDALDTTSADNGWFIVVTNSGKRLKRVDLDKVIDIAWAGIKDQGDLAPKWQEAINFCDSIRISKTHIFDCPKIAIPGQRYTMSTGVVQPTYISTGFDGTTLVKVAYSRAQCPYVVALRNASNTQDIYRNLEDGVQWNHALTCTSGKVKFVFVNTDVALVDGATRPSCIVTGNPPGTTYAYQCNMRVTNVEAYEFRAGHEVLGLNSWGYRFENCGFGGRIKDGKYSVWTSSTTNTDSGERCSYVNTFLSGIRLSTPAMYIYIDNTSSDFSLNCPVQIDATATYSDLRFINCHTEHFDEFVVNSDLTIGGAVNTFVTFSGGRILPTSYNRKNTHDIVLFNGNINILLSDGLFLENSAFPSSNNLGENLGQNGAVVETIKVRTKEARPRINGTRSKISIANDFTTDVLDTVISTSTPAINFSIVNIGNGLTASIKVSPETSEKTLALASSLVNGYVTMRSTKYTSVQAGKYYTCRPVIELTDSDSIGVPRHIIFWFDVDKNLLSTSKPPYDISLTSYIAGAEVPFLSRQTKRIPIVHVNYLAPAGAAYAKHGFELVNTVAGKTYYLHSVDLHDAIIN